MPIFWFLVKTYVLVFVLVWVRLSLPRLQVDQLMGFAWKILIPLGLANIVRQRRRSCCGRRSGSWRMAIFSWVALLAFVGLFDPVLRWRLGRAAHPAVAVHRAPRCSACSRPCARRSATFRPKKVTVQYPEQREQLPERSRGLFRVVIDPTSDDPRCRACTLCETNCPVQVIRVNYTSKYELPAPNEARIREAPPRRAAQASTSRCSARSSTTTTRPAPA